jgi:hypothetical protein
MASNNFPSGNGQLVGGKFELPGGKFSLRTGRFSECRPQVSDGRAMPEFGQGRGPCFVQNTLFESTWRDGMCQYH